jgi:hypothetical protein
MGQIRLGLFDLFSYIIPGIAIIIFMGLAVHLLDIAQLQMLFASLTLESAVVYIFLGYVVGFIAEGIAIRYVSLILDRVKGNVGERVLAKFKEAHPETKIKNFDINYVYSFVEVNSPKSIEKADTFFALGSLARNLSFAFLLFGVTSLVRYIILGNTVLWLYGISFLSIVLSLYLVFQADNFRTRSHRHLLNVYSVISETNIKSLENDGKLKKKS